MPNTANGSVQIHFRIPQTLAADIELSATAANITPSEWWRRAGQEQLIKDQEAKLARLAKEAKLARLQRTVASEIARAEKEAQRAANLASVKRNTQGA